MLHAAACCACLGAAESHSLSISPLDATTYSDAAREISMQIAAALVLFCCPAAVDYVEGHCSVSIDDDDDSEDDECNPFALACCDSLTSLFRGFFTHTSPARANTLNAKAPNGVRQSKNTKKGNTSEFPRRSVIGIPVRTHFLAAIRLEGDGHFRNDPAPVSCQPRV